MFKLTVILILRIILNQLSYTLIEIRKTKQNNFFDKKPFLKVLKLSLFEFYILI